MRPRRRLRERLYDVFERTAGAHMPKASLVSVVEDDQFFRESMRRLMRSLGYRVEVFASAADFLASPRLVETACLIADANMPVPNGVELPRLPEWAGGHARQASQPTGAETVPSRSSHGR